jgi:hypothetical protein
VLIFFRKTVLKQKQDLVVQELHRQKAFENPLIKNQWQDEGGVRREFAEYYGLRRFAWPVGLLCFFYFVAFLFLTEWAAACADHMSWIYPDAFVAEARLPLMAFLGVYLFNLAHTLRRLYVSDITPYVFWNEIQRLLMTMGLALALKNTVVGDSDGTRTDLVFFAVGFIVYPILVWVIDTATRLLGITMARTAELPLTLIQGINFWHEFRLEEEGIENAQNLANCDVVDLSIKTQYNLRTLVDWADQAILVQRLGAAAMEKLRHKCFISGAIDMAVSAPANVDESPAKEIAAVLEVQPIFVENLMDLLAEDKHVQMLWQLWQSDLRDQRHRGAGS